MAELHQVGANAGIDLGGKDWIKAAKRRRALAAFADQVDEERVRLYDRATFLRRTAARLPLRSNGRRKRLATAARCDLLGHLLPLALEGRQIPKLPHGVGGPHEQRAVGLLNKLVHAATT